MFVGVRQARRRERWSRERLLRDQATRLADVGRHAVERSAYYWRAHGADATRPLADLPTLSKQQVMVSFDEIVTDPRFTLAAVHMAADTGARLHGATVLLTSGNTGGPGATSTIATRGSRSTPERRSSSAQRLAPADIRRPMRRWAARSPRNWPRAG